LDSSEEAEALSFDGTVLILRSPRAFAPGSPIRFVALSEEGERPLEGRALGSKRIDEQFEVRIRFVNLRKEARELLLRRLG
jgi:hypothetical protein